VNPIKLRILSLLIMNTMKQITALLFLLMVGYVVEGQQWGDYTLYSLQNGTTANLVDTNGTNYHTWSFSSSARTGYSTYMLPGGTLVRTVARQGNSFQGGGMCGEVQKVNWNGTVLWDYVCSTTNYCSHHDICPMPNGNVLLIVYERKTASEVTQAGSRYSHEMWPDMIMEVQPFGATGGSIVWEWHAWDHLVQDYDATKNNYGVVADHPELIDLNYNNTQQTKDWMHVNGIDYNEQLDQVVISSHFLNELYVIDHSTTTEEAAGHSGGNSGRGGDILYRWGNPAAYDASGTKIFNVVHDAHWIPAGCPNATCLVGFNNNGVSQNKSSVDLISPPYNGYTYSLIPGTAYSPATYTLRHACNGHTNNEGNSQQLPNGNMLVCISQAGLIYEIDANQDLIWSKNIGGSSSHAYRYSRCYVEGTMPPPPSITQQNDTLYSSTGVIYKWYLEGILIPGANASYLVPEVSGTYQVSITDENGCESELSDPYSFELTGILEKQLAGHLTIYPVPSTGFITFDSDIRPEEIREICICDHSGRIVMNPKPGRTLDISTLADGIYVLVAIDLGGKTYTSKIILIR